MRFGFKPPPHSILVQNDSTLLGFLIIPHNNVVLFGKCDGSGDGMGVLDPLREIKLPLAIAE